MKKVSKKLDELSSDEKMIGLYDAEKEEMRIKRTQMLGAEKKGISQGQNEKAIEIAKNMIKDGIDKSFISKYTNLSENEIESLK